MYIIWQHKLYAQTHRQFFQLYVKLVDEKNINRIINITYYPLRVNIKYFYTII